MMPKITATRIFMYGIVPFCMSGAMAVPLASTLHKAKQEEKSSPHKTRTDSEDALRNLACTFREEADAGRAPMQKGSYMLLAEVMSATLMRMLPEDRTRFFFLYCNGSRDQD